MKRIYWVLIILGMLVIAGGIYYYFSRFQEASPPATSNSTTTSQSSKANQSQTQKYAYPIKNFTTNQTKKVFGQYITPATSPVQPERFTGYHTGVDIEISPSDLNKAVPVYSIYVGKVRYVGYVSGYGGVIVIQYTLNGQVVTALYGHIKLASATVKVGQTVKKGQELAILGKAYSVETDGERKHLHFAIHRGVTIDFRGYVQNKSELTAWIDPNSLY